MKKETGTILAQLVFDVSGKFDGPLSHVQASESESEFRKIRAAVGKIMGEMHFEWLEPHPAPRVCRNDGTATRNRCAIAISSPPSGTYCLNQFAL
jgi:hypothetical protein